MLSSVSKKSKNRKQIYSKWEVFLQKHAKLREKQISNDKKNFDWDVTRTLTIVVIERTRLSSLTTTPKSTWLSSYKRTSSHCSSCSSCERYKKSGSPVISCRFSSFKTIKAKHACGLVLTSFRNFQWLFHTVFEHTSSQQGQDFHR